MGKRILVADSDSVVQQVASYFLKLEGFEVEAVGDGVSAMEAIEKIAPDVIVMTPVLPGIHGLEVSHFVRDNPKYSTIPIIFLAESEEPLLNDIPDLSQKFRIVNKPIDPTKLVTTIKEHLDKGPVHAEDITESIKSIEELLGWEVSDKKMVQRKEEVPQAKSREKSFDVTEMLSGIMNVPEKEAEGSPEAQLTEEIPMSCDLTKEDENPVCHPVCLPGEEFPKQVRDDMEKETVGWAPPTAKAEDGGQCPPYTGLSDATHIGVGLTSEHEDAAKGGFETAEHREADLKSRITDEMIENMVRKIAVDIVERVTREIVPDIAEREITKEIERLKGTE